MKTVSIYYFDNKYVLNAMCTNDDGFKVLIEPSIICENDSKPDRLGEKFREALMKCVSVYHGRGTGKDVYDKIKKIANVKSEKAFMDKSQLITVEITENKIQYIPMKNHGKEGFEYNFNDVVIGYLEEENEKIGQKIIDAFLLCK